MNVSTVQSGMKCSSLTHKGLLRTTTKPSLTSQQPGRPLTRSPLWTPGRTSPGNTAAPSSCHGCCFRWPEQNSAPSHVCAGGQNSRWWFTAALWGLRRRLKMSRYFCGITFWWRRPGLLDSPLWYSDAAELRCGPSALFSVKKSVQHTCNRRKKTVSRRYSTHTHKKRTSLETFITGLPDLSIRYSKIIKTHY